MVTERRVFDAKQEEVENMMNFFSDMFSGFDKKTEFNLMLVCEEVLVNIVSYAYPNRDGQLTVVWEHDAHDRHVRIVFEDSGMMFNPLTAEDPDLDVPLEDRKIGGLGIMLVKKLMDTAEYAYKDSKNILAVTKKY